MRVVQRRDSNGGFSKYTGGLLAGGYRVFRDLVHIRKGQNYGT